MATVNTATEAWVLPGLREEVLRIAGDWCEKEIESPTLPKGLKPVWGAEKREEECSVCLQDLPVVGSEDISWRTAVMTRCGHRYHPCCISDAFTRAPGKFCPMCRTPKCKAHPAGADGTIVKFVGMVQQSVVLIQTWHDKTLACLGTEVNELHRKYSSMFRTTFEGTLTKRKALHDIGCTLTDLKKVFRYGLWHSQVIREAAKTFDEAVGCSITHDVLERYVARAGFVHDCSVQICSETSSIQQDFNIATETNQGKVSRLFRQLSKVEHRCQESSTKSEGETTACGWLALLFFTLFGRRVTLGFDRYSRTLKPDFSASLEKLREDIHACFDGKKH